MKKLAIIALIVFLVTGIFFRIFCGVFVIQPIGAIPEGVTIIYWRSGLNLPFISSVDGLLVQSGSDVTLLRRGLLLSKFAEPIKQREIFKLDYSEMFYLWSTDGKKYEN